MERTGKTLSLILIAFFLFGWRDSVSRRIIQEVNHNPIPVSAVWEHRLIQFGVKPQMKKIASITWQKEGEKFHFQVEDKEEWFYDGKNLYGVERRDKIIYILPLKREKLLTFWKIPSTMKPFGGPRLIGETEWQGRKVIHLRIEGIYNKAKVTINYLVDKDKKVLLKKEHILGPVEEPLWKESFQVKEIEFPSSLPPSVFQLPQLPGYVKVKKRLLTSPYLDTKF